MTFKHKGIKLCLSFWQSLRDFLLGIWKKIPTNTNSVNSTNVNLQELKSIVRLQHTSDLKSLKRNKQHIDFSDGVNNLDLLFCHPAILVIIAYVNFFCFQHGIDFKVTSIIRTEKENKALKSKSKTHTEGRAFDFSSKNIPLDKLHMLIHELNVLFGHLGAYSSTDGIQRVIIIHNANNSTGSHAHVQIHRNVKSDLFGTLL